MMHQCRLNRLRSAIRSVSQAHFSKYSVQQVPLLKPSQGGCSQGVTDFFFFSLEARAGILGGQTQVPRYSALGAARALPFCLSSPSSCSSPSPLPLVSISIVPLSPAACVQPGPAHAPQPATSSEAARHNYNQLLWLLAGQLCKQAS